MVIQKQGPPPWETKITGWRDVDRDKGISSASAVSL
jgi:hypothetical protein